MKLKHFIFTVFTVVMLGACNEETNVIDNQPVVTATEIEEKSVIVQSAEFIKEVSANASVTNRLIKETEQPTGIKYEEYKDAIEDSLIKLRTVNFSPTTPKEKEIINQVNRVVLEFETLFNWANERLTKWEYVYVELYHEQHSTVSSELDILLKMLEN